MINNFFFKLFGFQIKISLKNKSLNIYNFFKGYIETEGLGLI